MARKFLYFIAVCIVLVIAALVALRLWSAELTRMAFVPDSAFVEQPALAGNAYEDPAMWYSRPGLGAGNDLARWQPAFAADPDADPGAAAPPPAETEAGDVPQFAVFFVHPTSYLDRGSWNAPLDDGAAQDRASTFIKGLASPFNRASEIWAPRYRQATFGAFLTDAPEGQQALDAAYRDVSQAFDYFLGSVDPDMPIVLAGHSQGADHILRLLRERVAGTALQDRIAMVYPVGWPISVAHDLPALGLPACATARQSGCIMGWVSFAEPADPEMLLDVYAASPGFDGQPRGEDAMLCVNPLTGTIGGAADAAANLGTLVPSLDMSAGELVPRTVPARCSKRGLLLIGDPPGLGPYVLPGNNYHVYDILLFWRNLQQDVARRMRAWTAR
jgi:hypothetical protein